MSSAADWKAKGNQLLQEKDFDGAIEAYTQAINLDPSEKTYFSNRSAAYLSKGAAGDALSDGQRCIQLDPNWAKGHTRKAAALHSLRRYEEAVSAYEDGLKIAPDDSGLKNGLMEVKKILETNSMGGMGGMGGLFGPQMLAKLAGHPKFGPKLADPAFKMKLQMAQSNPQLLMSDPEMMEVLQVILGGMGADSEDAEAGAPPAAPQSKPARQPEPAVPLTAEEKAVKDARDASNSLKDKGNALYKNKQFDEALAAYEEALQADPTNLMVINNRAAAYIEMNKTDEAISICNSIFDLARERGVKLSFEERAKVHTRIAGAHLKRDDMDGAIAAYGRAQMEQFDKAIERKMKHLELERKKQKVQAYIDPELGLQAKERGNAAFREGNFPQAITEYEDAVKRDPTNAAYFNNLAAAYLKMGVFNDAKRSVEKSLELDRTYVKAWAKKGDIEFFMKEYHKSLDSYKAGLQIEPDNSLCKQGLQKTTMKVQELNHSGEEDKERSAHAMADPEIQCILQDPSIRQVLNDFQQNPKFAQEAMMNDASIRAKIEKLVVAGVLQVK